MISRKEKNKHYLELWDAFHGKGCPVCACVNAGTTEQVRTARVAESGEKDLGLCVSHTALMAAGNDEYGCRTALRFIRDVERWLRGEVNRNERRPDTRTLVKTFFAGNAGRPPWPSSSGCAACRYQRRSEKKILDLLLDALTDPDFDRSFRESDGLCFHHLFLLNRLYPGKPVAAAVLKTQLRKLEDLRDAISPHRFQPERMGLPADPKAWERLKVLLGEPPGDPGEEGDDSFPGLGIPTDPPFEDALPADADAVEDRDWNNEIFEKEKLRRSIVVLQKRLNEESSRAAALHYSYFKAVEDNKTLQMNLAGAEALARSLEEQVARLRVEILQSQGKSAQGQGARRNG